VSLVELQSVRGTLRLPIERDRHFEAVKSISAYAEEAREGRRSEDPDTARFSAHNTPRKCWTQDSRRFAM
jgi:hypothetical protein